MKKQFDLIDFFDSSQIYLDILSVCSDALKYYSNLIGDSNIRSVSPTINFAIEELKRIHSRYLNFHVTSKSDKENNNAS